jgi:hypothetical protein
MKRGRHERIECRHRKKRTVENAGIQRRVCDKCGHVSFNYLFDVFAEEQQQLETRPPQA